VPYQKQQAEKNKTALTLLLSDRGGIAYQPIIGLHKEVGEIDFVSMYPSIMVKCNISPETHPTGLKERSDEPPGLIPRTLAPLLQKRIDMKFFLESLEDWDPRKKVYQSQVSAHKWLLVTCFGYLGYKNARFGRIESHEAVTATGREALFRAKEAAELMGYDLLHMYVDGLWVYKKGQNRPEHFQKLLDGIAEETGLSISLNGVYRWVVFLASRNDPRVPVANRYFGVFQNGMIKTRGIEIRRSDTPLFIGKAQVEILEYLALAQNAGELKKFVPGAVAIVQKKMRQLSRLEFDVDDLWVTQRLSRELQAYRVATPSALAAGQLHLCGKDLQPGQKIQFVYIRGKPGVFARDLPLQPEEEMIDIKRYQVLLLRAAETVLKPFGWDQEALRSISGGIPALQRKLWHFPT
jgi:DNA polymerase-2